MGHNQTTPITTALKSNQSYISYSSDSLPCQGLEVEQCGIQLLEATNIIQTLKTLLWKCEDWILVLFKTSFLRNRHALQKIEHIIQGVRTSLSRLHVMKENGSSSVRLDNCAYELNSQRFDQLLQSSSEWNEADPVRHSCKWLKTNMRISSPVPHGVGLRRGQSSLNTDPTPKSMQGINPAVWQLTSAVVVEMCILWCQPNA